MIYVVLNFQYSGHALMHLRTSMTLVGILGQIKYICCQMMSLNNHCTLPLLG